MHSLAQHWEDGKWYLHCKEEVLHRVMYPKAHANGFQNIYIYYTFKKRPVPMPGGG